MGGITAPGIRISAKALWEDAAKLSEIEIKKPDNILGKDTITSMQAGLVYGQIGQTEYIINKVKEETGMYDAKEMCIRDRYHGVYNRWSHDLPESIYDRRNDSERQFQDTAHA